MQLFNVGALELLFILLLALIVLGPRKTIKTAGEVGRWIKDLLQSQFWQDLQKTSNEIRSLPKKLMDEAEIQKTIDELDRSEAALRRSMSDRDIDVQNEDTWEDAHSIEQKSPNNKT
jgi:Sec-independent protein translocase protein TatA